MTLTNLPHHRSSLLTPLLRVVAALLLATFVQVRAADAADNVATFDIPAEDAATALRQFTTQSGAQLVYDAEGVAGIRTTAVQGALPVREALGRLLAGTPLTYTVDARSGTLAVGRARDPNAGRAALTQPSVRPQAPARNPENDGVVQLQAFEVAGDKDYGYRRTNSTTSSRIGVPIITEPQAIEVISSELLQDFAISDFNQVFRYSSSVTVGENEVGQASIFSMRGFELPRLVNGMHLTSSFSLTPYLVTDNVDRIEIAKGAVGLFYANSTPNGVANYVTKKPQYRDATHLGLSYGSYNYQKVSVDVQNKINDKAAYRIISSFQAQDGRVKEQHREYVFVAPSLNFRPSDRFEIAAEYDYTKYKIAYPPFAWFWAFNPQYYEDISNPSRQILDYFQSHFGAANDDAARALIQQRWNTASYPTFINTWQADRTAITGQPTYTLAGSNIDWWRFSPDGDRAYQYGPASNADGYNWLADVAVTARPFDRLTLRYHWVHQYTGGNFARQWLAPTGGFGPDGRIRAMNLTYGSGRTLDHKRIAVSDAQQLDALFEFEAFNVKHKFVAGAEWTRAVGQLGNAGVDYSKASNPAAWTAWDPFSGEPIPDYYQVIDGVTPITTTSIANYRAYYLSYRASAFDDRLNVLAGVRRSQQLTPDNSANTPTIGAIYEFVPGFRVFASYSQTVVFTNTLSAIGGGVTAADNPHALDNEKDKGYEVGLKTNWRDNTLSGTLSLYRDERSGIVKADTARFNADPRNVNYNPSTGVQFFVNGGVVRTEGLDGDLTWTPNRAFQAIFNFGYMFTSETVSDPSIDPTNPNALIYVATFNRRLQKSPEWTANLVGKYSFLSGPLQDFNVGAALRYSDSYILASNYNFNLIAPSEVLLDMFAGYQTKLWSTPTNLRLTLTNVTNEINDMTRSNGFEARLSVDFSF